MRSVVRRVPLGVFALVLGLGVLAGVAPAAQAAPAAPGHLVISEVNGDQSGVYRTNWVELYNPTDAAITLGTLDTSTTPATVAPAYFLCYASQSGSTCTSPYRLYGTVLAHHHFLVELYDAGGTLPAFPDGVTPDLDFGTTDPALNPSQQVAKNIGGYSTGGQLLLLDAAADPTGAYPTAANVQGSPYSSTHRNLGDAGINPSPVVDAVGYTPAASASALGGTEGWTSTSAPHPAPVQDSSHWDERTFVDGVPTDTNDNAADFVVSQRDPISQAGSRVTVAPVADAVASTGQAITPITVVGSRGVGSLHYAATGLPDGVTIDAGTGVVSGTPAVGDAMGAYPVTVTVSDQTPGTPDTATTTFTLTLSDVLRVDPLPAGSADKGEPLSPVQVQAHGGHPAYSYAATGLPAGVDIDAGGSISGTPTGDVGSYPVHVTVTDSGNGGGGVQSVSTDFVLTELPSSTGPAADDPLAGLTINEVEATGTTDRDWVELYDAGADVTGAAVDLVDASGAAYHVTGLTVAAGGYAVVEGTDLHAAGLDLAASDTLYLAEAGDDVLLDRTTWTAFQQTSWARTTDGSGAFALSAYATKGSANSGAPVIAPNDLVVTEVNYDNNSTDYYEYSEVTNTTGHPIDFATYGLTLRKSGVAMTFHDPSDTTSTSPTVDPVIPAHTTQLFWWVETQYYGVKTTAQFLTNYGLAPTTPVVLVFGFSSLGNSGGDHSYDISVNQGTTLISQAWVDTPCAANTLNGAALCPATNGNYAEHFQAPADHADPVAAIWYNSLASGGDTVNHSPKPPLSSPGTVDLEQLGFTRAVKISSVQADSLTLHDTADHAVDLSGYVLLEDAIGPRYTLPAGSTVAPGNDLVIGSDVSALHFGDRDYATLLAPPGYSYTDGIGLADTSGPFLHTLTYDASSGQPPVIDPTTGLPLPPAGGLYRPAGVSSHGDTVYVSNTGDNVLAALSGGTNTIVAGSLDGYGDVGDEGPAQDAYLYQPGGTAEDAAGNIFIADSGDNVVREITTDGTIHLFAGTGAAGGAGSAVTPTSTPTSVNLWRPGGVAVDAAGNVFIADTSDHRVLEVSAGGVISVVAGTGRASYSGDGGAATAATLAQPAGLAVDAQDNVYIADSANNVVRRVDASTGVITTVAGNYATDQETNGCLGGFSGDGGAATSAQLNDPQAVALDGAGDLFIADTFNNAVREVTPDGVITTLVNASTVAGPENTGPTGSGALPSSTRLNTPSAIAVDRTSGVLYLADTRNNAIASVIHAGRSGAESGPVESADALEGSSSTDATTACAVLANGPVVSTSAPTVEGTVEVGSTLTATTGGWTPTPDAFAYQWLRDGAPIDGATAATYAVSAADVDHLLAVQVTATKTEYAPGTATSASVSVPTPVLFAGTPKITGSPDQGSTLTAKPGAWTPTPDAFAYQWLRDGDPIPDATGATYTTTATDTGHRIAVSVTGTKAGYEPAAATSAPVTVQGPSTTLTTVRPTIGGTARVGRTLTADHGTWHAGTKVLPDSAFTYRWLRNGAAIAGATNATYTLVAADNGTQVSVTVTGHRSGYTDAARTSASHTVAAGVLSTTAAKVTGTVRVGSTVSVHPAAWHAGPTEIPASALRYQWSRNGTAIAGATSATYTLVAADSGTQVSVTVTGKAPGYTTATRTSTPQTVEPGLLTTVRPTVTGTPRVGRTLTAQPGAWTAGGAPVPADHFAYQWYADGTALAGATAASLVLAPATAGTRLTVTVTAHVDGYATASAVSKATNPVTS